MSEDDLEGRRLVPAVWEAEDQSDASQRALQYQSWLAESLERDYDQVVLKTARYKAIPPELIRAATAGVQASRRVLWSGELLQDAVRDRSRYSEQVVDADDLPYNPDLWLCFGGAPAQTMRLGAEQFVVGARLVLPFPEQRYVVYLKVLHPLVGASLDPHAVPTLALCGTLHAGELVARNQGTEMFSCLRFLNEVIEADRNAALAAKSTRKVERTTSEETGVRISVLRKKDFQTDTASARAPRQLQCHYLVQDHVRRPSPRMRHPRPVPVKAHLRGPADKPLKGRTPTIYVVRR